MKKSKIRTCYAAHTITIRSMQALAAICFLERVVLNTKNMIKKSLDCARKDCDALKCCDMRLCGKEYCCYDSLSNNVKFSSNELNKRTDEDSGDAPTAKKKKSVEQNKKCNFCQPWISHN